MQTQPPTTQTAIVFSTSSSTLSLSTTAPVPTTSTEHLLRVHATAITNGELTWAPYVSWPTDHIPCFDVSGTILTPVAGSPFHVGDRVFGRIAADREGAARQFASILPSETALVPEGVNMTEASAVPMSALTAWQGVFEKGLLTGGYGPEDVPRIDEHGKLLGSKLANGKRVLVLGASGGVGIFAVHFTKLAGAEVVGTTSGRNAEFVRGLGAEVLDYTQTSVKNWIAGEHARKFDLVIDCVGGDAMMDGWNAVKKGSVYVSVVPGFKEPEGGMLEGVKAEWFVMESRGAELRAIGKFMEKGLIRACVDSVWGMDEFEDAFNRTASGRARGKVVIQVDEDRKES